MQPLSILGKLLEAVGVGVLATIFSCAVLGVDAVGVEVQVDVSSGLPSFEIVGLPSASVREARDRVRSAIKNSGFQFPLGRVTVNLAPADLPKGGTLFDLPIAMGILIASGQLSAPPARRRVVLLGELSLDGSVRAIFGALCVAASLGGSSDVLIIPRGNRQEVEVVAGVNVVAVSTLREAAEALAGGLAAVEVTAGVVAKEPEVMDPWAEVRGQDVAKRALEIAIAGGHHVMLSGPPGAGKTLLARQAAKLAPPLSPEEIVEVSKIYSVAGLLSEARPYIRERPFRSPHHTVTAPALLGGGAAPRPGEVSLAHRGFLFLDEFGEFERSVIESLREPLEEGMITIARLHGRSTFPARFTLIAALNPCPCGYLHDRERPCTCRPSEIDRYRRKLSGPILDRIDLFVRVDRPPISKVLERAGRSLTGSQDRVLAIAQARRLQRERFGTDTMRNGEIPFDQVLQFCRLDREGERLLQQAAQGWSLSPRSIHRVLRVSRTIADLDGREEIIADDVLEALSYRREALFP